MKPTPPLTLPMNKGNQELIVIGFYSQQKAENYLLISDLLSNNRTTTNLFAPQQEINFSEKPTQALVSV